MKKPGITAEKFREDNPELAFGHSLLALSGGIDSMALAFLLLKSGVNFSAAHCNFQLRDEDSGLDEIFVKDFCNQHRIKLFTRKFDVKAFKQNGNYSTQMAARELRYAWFDELMQENGFDFLLTAHQLDDSLETFLINLSRGTGIKGLTGIKRRNQKILRPLLNLSKQEIKDFASLNNIQWREDRTNSTSDYARNKIRNEIFPLLEETHPGFKENFQKTIEQLKGDAEIIQNHIRTLKDRLFEKEGDEIRIDIAKLKALSPTENYIFHLFSEYEFNTLEVLKLINSRNNGYLISNDFRLIKNRTQLILTENPKEIYDDEIDINQGQIIEKPIYLKVLKSDSRDLNASESLDCGNIEFPLRLRKPKTGDVFQPLGLKGSKKLSKFFKDEKYSMTEKEKAWILTDSKGEILCITGKRIDERFKITEHTQFFLNIYLC